MSQAAAINPTPWGEREIRGPVHLFRERIMMRLFRPKLDTGVVVDAGCGSGCNCQEVDVCCAAELEFSKSPKLNAVALLFFGERACIR